MAPIQWYFGILGLTGLTAYVGLLNIAQLVDNNNNDTPCLFLQLQEQLVLWHVRLQKLWDASVIGSVGSHEKVKWLLRSS